VEEAVEVTVTQTQQQLQEAEAEVERQFLAGHNQQQDALSVLVVHQMQTAVQLPLVQFLHTAEVVADTRIAKAVELASWEAQLEVAGVMAVVEQAQCLTGP
jgi:hypothetical protein